MTRRSCRTNWLGIGWIAVLSLAATTLAASAQVLVVEADLVYPVSGPVIQNGIVIASEGRIVAVGRKGEVEVPDGAERLAAAVVTPGLIDVDTSVGIAGILNVPADRDQDENTDPDQSALQVRDAFNPREPLLRYLLERGVTLAQVTPGPANPIAGQAGIFRTVGENADEMALRFPSALVFNLGEQPKSTYQSGGTARFPATRMGTAALIRRRLQEGRRYLDERDRAERARESWLGSLSVEAREPDLDPGLAVLGRVATGEIPALIRAHRADDILTAVRLIEEFGLQGILSAGTEAYLVRDELGRAGIPVFVGPVMERVGSPEHENASYENPALLVAAEIPIAIRSGFESYVPRARVVLFEAAIAAANGLGAEPALRAITLDAARLLGIEQDFGSLEAGKVADLVLFDGDPFEYRSHVTTVIVAGSVVHRRGE